ncbi:MAG: alpha-amylase family glycosyl hydrolase [Rhodothermales bacterium]
MNRIHSAFFAILALLALPLGARAQSVDVTFRYLGTPADGIVRAFVPGEFNNWGPNANGAIATNAASLMTFVDSLGQWIYTTPLQVGQTYQYKVHIHRNDAGTDYAWITDPLNPRFNPAENNNSVVTVSDPMVFQPATEGDADGLIDAVSAGVFGSQPLAAIDFWINGVARDGMPYYNAETGVFRYDLPALVKAGSQFKIRIRDVIGRQDSLEIGALQRPVSWSTTAFRTVRESVTPRALIARQDGRIDSTVTGATLYVNDIPQSVEVAAGVAMPDVALALGENALVLEAVVDGETFASDTLRLTRRLHPLDRVYVDADVQGAGGAWQVLLTPTDNAPADLAVEWSIDSLATTAPVDGVSFAGLSASGTAGAGEIYLEARSMGGGDPEGVLRRIAVIVEEDGTAREMAYDETPAWVDRAVVYEIFPLSFGPQATGTEANPGQRFNQIAEELDYIAQMGFTTLWFMPVMNNQFMDPISGGYNIIDFYNVDPKLGTNDDFKRLVARAHELGLKVILDITPNHASPAHPWVDALKQGGSGTPPGSYIQVEPSDHNRGLDGRGPNLPEVWQASGGANLYRKYDGFGDLANLNWDDDDLQAEFLDILAHWVEEFDIDGWRFDVYWGPWRRYGPERFGRPIRTLMKRIRPDAWLLGEIAGTGFSTEVYYADDDNGTPVEGGIDAGYDWNFYFNAIRGTYPDIANYDNQARNGDFWPGPHARYFRFLENHDEQRIAKSDVIAGNPLRILPLTGFLLTTTGIPMIYQGQEVNFGNVAGDERRVSVSWQTALNGSFARFHQQLAHARTQFPAFSTQDITTLSTANAVYSFVRPYLDENAVVAINFSSEARTVTLNPTAAVALTTDGPVVYHDLFGGTSFVDDALDGFDLTLDPFETVVLIANGGQDVAFDLPALPALPFNAVYTGVERGDDDAQTGVLLDQNYPNPVRDATLIRYVLPEAGPVKLEVYDILGRLRAVLVDGVQAAGVHLAPFERVSLPSGTYFYRLDAGGTSQTRTMTIAR